MRLSVIVPIYNALPAVIACINSLMATSDRALTEIVVQDDSSSDYNGPVLLGSLCQRNTANLGFAGNCNVGAERATGDVLFFLNQDCAALTPGWDARLLATFDELPQAGIIGPTLAFPDGRVQSVGGKFDYLGQPYHEALGFANLDWDFIASPRRVSWVTGAALAIRHELWQTIGGFDLAYGRGYFEDVELCCRVRELGGEVWHEPRIRFTHEVGSAGGNPRMLINARLFRQRWVDTGKVKPDVNTIRERFWR